MSVQSPKTILLVDDEIINASVTSKIIKSFGYNVVNANTGEEAVDIFKKSNNIDLILMDIDLGSGIDGTEAAVIILKDHDVPVLFLSSHTEAEIVEKTEKITSYGYVVKGCGVTVLHASIKMAFKLFEALKKEKIKEQALRKSEHDLLRTQGLAHLGSWYLDIATNEVSWTEELYKMYGFDLALPPPPYTEHMKLFTSESWQILSAALLKTRQTGIPYELELKTVRKDGGNGWMWVRGEAVVDADGNTIGLWGAAQDITERKLVEIKLDETQAILKAAMDHSTAGIAIANTDGSLRYVNDAGLLIRGGSREELVNGVGINQYVANWKLFDLDGRPLKNEDVPLARAVMYGETNHREFIIRRDNHEDRVIMANAAPIKNNDGKVVAAVVVFIDITERKRVEEALKESENRYRGLIGNIDAGVVVHAPDTSIIMNNSRASELLGLNTEQLCGKLAIDPEWKFLKENGQPYTVEEYPVNQIARTKKPIKDLILCINRPVTNDIVRVSVNGLPLMDSKGEISEIVISFIDITERKRAEEALQESKLTFRKLFEDSSDAILLIDETGVFVECNQAALDLLKMTREQFLFLPPVNISPEYQPNGKKSKESALEMIELAYQKGLHRFDWTCVNAGGGEFIVEVSLMPIMIKGKTMLHTTWRDITERKRAEEKIKNLLTEKELLLKEVHHRIKNNMNTVAGIMSLQIETLKEPSALAALKDARSRVQSMVVLYDKLYRLEDLKELSFKEYISPLMDEIICNFPNRAIVKIEKNIESFMVDTKKTSYLGIIINELLTNIMKYAFTGRDNGLITISASTNDNRAMITVQDNGIGIPESMDITNSTGFGLQLVDMMARQLLGRIKIERDNGTKIILEFNL